MSNQIFERPQSSTPGAIDAGSTFGEQIDTHTGGVQFRVADVSARTNHGLPMSFGRRLDVSSHSLQFPNDWTDDYWNGVHGGYEPQKEILGPSWELDVPYMRGTYDARYGWTVLITGTGHSTARCSAGNIKPPDTNGLYPFFSTIFKPEDFWDGVQINIPGAGQENLLALPAGVQVPTDGLTYRGTTASNWRVSCLPSIKNSDGEGFLVVLPDGTRYRFDWMASKRRPSIMSGGTVGVNNGMNQPVVDTVSPQAILPRADVYLYATRIEDRFGNWVAYDYDAQNPFRLKSITSSEGASIAVTYNSDGLVGSVSHAGHTWTYQYKDNLLTFQYGSSARELERVIAPDGSAWEYDIGPVNSLFGDNETKLLQKYCVINTGNMTSGTVPDAGDSAAITIKAPSGAQGVFRIRELVHGTNRSPGNCHIERVYWETTAGTAYQDVTVVEGIPLLSKLASIYEKEVTGPGLTPMKWSYSYQPSWSYLSNCPAPESCGSTSQTAVTGPDGVITRYVYGNEFGTNASRQLTVTKELGGTSFYRQDVTYMASVDGQPFADVFGIDVHAKSDPLLAKNRPVQQVKVQQDGVTFTRTSTTFDTFARPASVISTSTLGYSKTEGTTYSDNLSKWVLGQVAVLTTNGIETTRTDFDAVTALPTKSYSFGRIEQSLTYNADGTVATQSDGRDGVGGAETTITFSNWKRGIPQLVSYPPTADALTGTFKSAVVNTDGTIASTTDENGDKTCYAYDAVGRLAQVTYPSELSAGMCDSTTWAATSFSFAPVASIEYGIEAGHWKQTVSTGNARMVTLFDAFWRPLVEETYDYASPNATRSIAVKRYDIKGNLAFQSYPVNSISDYASPAMTGIRTTYDAMDRVSRVEQNSELGVLTSVTEYLPGLKTRVTNARGKQTTTSYMAFDSPSFDWPTIIDHPEAARTVINRDVFGKPLNLTRSSSEGQP